MNGPAASAGGFRHASITCPADDELARAVLAFVTEGAQAREPVLIAAAGPVLPRLRRELDSYGGKVTWTGLASASVNPGRVTAAVRTFAAEHAGEQVRCVQEPAWHLLSGDHLQEAVRQHALLNLALAGCGVSMLCAYGGPLPPPAEDSVLRTHPLLVRDGRWQPNPAYPGAAALPAEAAEPLPPPPRSAAALAYRTRQVDVREFTARQAQLAGLPHDRVTDLVIAVSEVTANTLLHTGEPGRLWVWAADGEVVCQVEDTGHIRDPLAGSFLRPLAEPGGGRGLWTVHQLCDLVQIRTGAAGTTIRLHMRLAGHDQTDSAAPRCSCRC